MSMTETEILRGTTTASQEKAKKSEPRPYVVLRKVAGTSPSDPQTWVFVRNITAASQEQAIRAAAEVLVVASEDDKVTLVAIPARSFKPVTVSSEVQTKLKFS